jgi:hypothetical protein
MSNLLKLGLNKWGSLVIESFLCIEEKDIVYEFVNELFADISLGEVDPVLTLMQNEYGNFVLQYIYKNVDAATQKIITTKLRIY